MVRHGMIHDFTQTQDRKNKNIGNTEHLKRILPNTVCILTNNRRLLYVVNEPKSTRELHYKEARKAACPGCPRSPSLSENQASVSVPPVPCPRLDDGTETATATQAFQARVAYLGRQDLVQDVRVVAQRNSRVGGALVDVDVFVDVHHILPFRIYLHQHLETRTQARGQRAAISRERGARVGLDCLREEIKLI